MNWPHPSQYVEEPPRRNQPGYRVLVTGVFFAFVGPLVTLFCLAGLIAAGAISNHFSGTGHGLVHDLTQAAKFALVGIPFAYMFGLIPAFVAGVFVGSLRLVVNPVPWYDALVIGLFVGAAFAFIYRHDFILGGPSGRIADYVLNALFCVVPTMICWAMVRNWFVEKTTPRGKRDLKEPAK